MGGDNDTRVPWIERETSWKVIVLGLAGIYGIGLIFGFLALIIPGHEDFASATEIFWRLALIGGAVVTFATVMWRGMIATRQADQQQRQVEQVDENNLAALLQKGAELINDKNQKSQVAAGIATLQTVATTKNRRFSVPAMDLLAGYIEADSGQGHQVPNVRAAIVALRDAHELTGLSSSRRIKCIASEPENTDTAHNHPGPTEWMPVLGVQSVTYVGGTASNRHFRNERALMRFERTKIRSLSVTSDVYGFYRDCEFEYCIIKSLGVWQLRTNQFDTCDFSGADISGASLPPADKIKGSDNYYNHGDPPMFVTDDKPARALTDWDFVQEQFDDPFVTGGPQF